MKKSGVELRFFYISTMNHLGHFYVMLFNWQLIQKLKIKTNTQFIRICLRQNLVIISFPPSQSIL